MTTVKELRRYLKHWKNETEITGTVWLRQKPGSPEGTAIEAEIDIFSKDRSIFYELTSFGVAQRKAP
ncbi:MAG: hypothetical protein WCK53_14265 [Methanomicrobiales archaeon]